MECRKWRKKGAQAGNEVDIGREKRTKESREGWRKKRKAARKLFD